MNYERISSKIASPAWKERQAKHSGQESIFCANAERNLSSEPEIQLRLVAHDLRTPLQAIRLHADALSLKIRQPDDPEFHSWLKSIDGIMNCVGEMVHLIDRLTERRVPSTFQTGIRPTLADVIKVCPRASELPLHIAPNLPDVNLCREDLFQVIQNLVTNSVRHGGKSIRLDAAESGRFIDIHYADDGPGIPFSIFSHFENQMPPQSYDGHGTGLWLVSRLLAAHNGKLLPSRHHHQDGICIRLMKYKDLTIKSGTHPTNPGD